MKKILLFLLLLPFTVKAYSVDEYKIDITVMKNGNLNVIEAFKLSGEYNGFERIINYKNNFNSYKGDFLKSVDTELYDGKGISLNEVRAINYETDVDILTFKEDGDLFEEGNAKKGDYGLYTVEKKDNSYRYKIYNPSKMNKGFYLDYELEDVVINHQDVAELFYQTEILEDIGNIKVYIHIPNNKNNLKVWIHDMECNVEIIDNENILLNINQFNNIINFRLIFDNDIITTNKKTDEDVLKKIEDIENNYVDFDEVDDDYEILKQQVYELVSKVEKSKNRNDYNIAKKAVDNLNDDKYKTELIVKLINIESQVERKETLIEFTLFGILGLWLAGFIGVYYQFYKRYSKKNEYYDKILEHEDYKPYIVGYVINRNISKNELISSILYLYFKGNISISKNYVLKKEDTINLDISDERILKLIFDNKEAISIKELNKYINNNYDKFIKNYSNWINSVMDIINSKKLFENLIAIKMIGIIYSFIGILLSLVLYNNLIVKISIIVMSLLSILLFLLVYKRTTKGNFIYEKFDNLKKDLNKNIPEKDLEINLIYSIVFGNFSKIEKNILLNIDVLNNKKYYLDTIKLYSNLYNELSKLIDEANKRKKESTL